MLIARGWLHRRFLLGLVFTTGVVATSPASAQLRIGLHGAYQNEVLNGVWGAGVRAETGLPILFDGLSLASFYEHYFPDCGDCSLRNYGAMATAGGTVYFGVGASFVQWEPEAEMDDEVDSGEWRAIAATGLRLETLPIVIPYAEFRIEVGSGPGNRQTFVAGVFFNPTRRRPAPRQPGFPG